MASEWHDLLAIWVPLILGVAVCLVAYIRYQSARQLQVQGVMWLQAMRTLITHIQRHRGLSVGVLSGDSSMTAPLNEVRQQINWDLAQISGVGDWIKGRDGWQVITQHWARLVGAVNNLSASRSMDQHNRLIKNILVFIDDIAFEHQINILPAAKAGRWRELLALAELLGQARAMGTALLVNHRPADELVNKKLIQELQELQKDILNQLELTPCRQAIAPPVLEQILGFLTYIDRELVTGSKRLSASDFYGIATRTVDGLYEQFDSELAEVNRRLSS
jgi:hypothetical protein